MLIEEVRGNVIQDVETHVRDALFLAPTGQSAFREHLVGRTGGVPVTRSIADEDGAFASRRGRGHELRLARATDSTHLAIRVGVGRHQALRREVDGVGEHREVPWLEQVVDVEAPAVGHDGDVRAGGAQSVDQRTEAGIDRDLGGDGASLGFGDGVGDAAPLQLDALATADRSRSVLVVERLPTLRVEAFEQVHADIGGRDGSVEVEEHRGVRQVAPPLHPSTLAHMTTSEVFTVERDGHVATLWLDRPEARNAMGPAFWADLPGVMDELSDDDDVRVVVVAAKGKSFCVGLDLKSMGGGLGGGGGEKRSPASNANRFYKDLKRMQGAITSVADCPKPVIAAIHSHCIGGGVDLITACDIRLASADAIFSVRETKIAIVADVGTLQRLPRVIAPGHVAELAYTGKDVDAAFALRIGLVNEVLPNVESLHKSAFAMAAEIAANSPLAVQGTKQVLRASAERTVAEGLDYVAAWNAGHITSNDLTEAMVAFMEKREAKFEGN